MRYLRFVLSLGILIIFSSDNKLSAQELYKVLEADTRGIFGLRWDKSNSSWSTDNSSGLLSVSSTRFYSTSSFDDIYRERSADYTTKISKITQLSGLEMPLNQGRGGAAIGLEYGYSSSYAYRKSSSDQEYILERKLERFAFRAGRRFFSDRLDITGSIGSNEVFDKMKHEYSINIRVRPSENYSFMSSVRKRRNSFNMELNYENEHLPVASSATNDVWAVGFEVKPTGYFLINMKYEEGLANSGEESNVNGGYRFEPISESNLLNGNISIQARDRFMLEFIYTVFRTDGKITLMRRDQKRGKMTRFNFYENDLEFKASVRSSNNSAVIFDYGRYSIKGNQKGHIESNIIPSPLIFLLGTRFNYRGRMDADMTRVRLGYTATPGKKFSFAANLGYIWFNPNFDLRSWQSEFLVFGLRDFQHRNLRFNELQAIVPEIQFRYNVGPFGIMYAFAQAIPTVVRGGTERPPGTPSTGGNVYSQYGGGFHVLEFSIIP